jgi:hypothetical protein
VPEVPVEQSTYVIEEEVVQEVPGTGHKILLEKNHSSPVENFYDPSKHRSKHPSKQKFHL